MGVSWIPFLVSNEIGDLWNEEGRRICCPRTLKFSDADQKSVLCCCGLLRLVHFVDGPEALNRGVKKARIPGVPHSPARFRRGWAAVNISLRFSG